MFEISFLNHCTVHRLHLVSVSPYINLIMHAISYKLLYIIIVIIAAVLDADYSQISVDIRDLNFTAA